MTTEEFIADHTAARYILLVGRPDAGEGTAGALINETMADSGNILQLMLESASDSMAVRYGLWNNPQTVVMLSNVRPSDHIRVLGVFKSMSMDVTDRAVTVEYLNPRSCMILDQMDLLRTTDANLWAKLDNMETFSVSVELMDGTTVAHPMSDTTGLEPVDVPMDKFWDISVSENIQDDDGDEIKNVLLELFYTVDDLDRTGDGDADDPADLDEDSLALFIFDESSGNWTRLSEDLEWVVEVGVETADVTLFGREYAGHMRAVLAHLSLFGPVGRRNEPLPTSAITGGDLVATAEDEIAFDGTASTGNGPIASFTWTFEDGGETITLEGIEPVYTFMIPGEYVVTLKVTD
ncbi:MAG: PKD domain-containing protein, partial [Planctomycetes bacterium]|nr:PKD domain-containing protein [Planctomycetota bacterium]